MVHGNVILADRVKIGSHCEIGLPTPLGDKSPLRLGAAALIRSHSTHDESSSFGPGLVTGHHVTIREKTIAGQNFQAGSYADIQGSCSIGDFVRLHSGVFICQNTRIGNFVWVLPHAVFTNDPHPPSDICLGPEIGHYAVVCANAVILPGVKIGEHALIAAQSCVRHDVAPFTAVAGVPARSIGETKKFIRRDGSDRPAYPWPAHFSRGYPPSVTAAWAQIFETSS